MKQINFDLRRKKLTLIQEDGKPLNSHASDEVEENVVRLPDCQMKPNVVRSVVSSVSTHKHKHTHTHTPFSRLVSAKLLLLRCPDSREVWFHDRANGISM